MTPAEALMLVVSLLSPVRIDMRREKDRRVYAALLAARVALSPDPALAARLADLQREFA